MSRYIICPECEGEGHVGTLGAFSAEEFTECFDTYDEYMHTHAASMEPCKCCKGQRVVTPARVSEWDEYMREVAEYAAESRWC